MVPPFFADGAFAYRPAIYDGWVYVTGRGILDKRSFLPAVSEPEAGDDGATETPHPTTAPDATPVSPFAWVVGALIAAAGALAVLAVVGGRR